MKSFGYIIGRLGAKPEIVEINGKAVCRFSLAVDEGYTKNGERVEKTGWHQIEAWDELAKYISNFSQKGQKMIAKVRIQDGTYEKDGVKVYKTKFTAEEVELMPYKESTGRITTDEIPF
jgi:single stranded DNA-binding protein